MIECYMYTKEKALFLVIYERMLIFVQNKL